MAETETDNILEEVRAAALENAGGTDGSAADPADHPERHDAEAGAEPQETAQQAADRARDEATGRFVKAEEGKPRETLKLKEKPQEQPAATPGTPSSPQDAPAAPVAAKPGEEPIAPPAEWKGAGKVQWNKLPKAIQAELRETYQGLEATRQQFAPIEQAIAPHRDTLIREAGTVESGIHQLLEFHQLSLTNAPALALHLLRARGIDPRQFAEQILGQSQGTPQNAPQQPDINSLIAQAVQQRIAPIEQQFAQTRQQQVYGLLGEFQNDPKHPYFNDVADEMQAYIAVERASGKHVDPRTGQENQRALLEASYDRAVWANPTIRAQLMAAQAEEVQKNQAAAAAKANQARAASLRGSPLPNGSGATGSGATVLDDVRAAMTELSGA